jgi:hypothetical protein
VHKEHEFLLKLEKAGLTDELAQRVIDSESNALASKVVRLIRTGGFEPMASHAHAREIMGNNFFGIEEAIRYFGISPTRWQLAILSEIPFSDAVLKKARDTHILVAVFPISILEIRGKVRHMGLFRNNQDWYNEMPFAKERCETRWQLICKTAVNGSALKNWQKQYELIGADDYIPSAKAMVYAIIGYYLATGVRLFETTYVRTISTDPAGTHIDVGYFTLNGLEFYRIDDDDSHDDDLGIASSKESS